MSLLQSLRRDYLARMYMPPKPQDWLFRSFRSYMLSEKAYRQLPEVRTAILTGESGRRWAEFYRSRPEEYYLEGFREQLGACERLLHGSGYGRFLQIGCAGGRELAILAARFPKVRFCGIDINAEAIRENQQTYSGLGNLEFRVEDLTKSAGWAQWRPDVIYTSGCLEYLAQAEVVEFFRRAHEAGVSRLVVSEPTDPGVKGASTRRGSAAFAHDYPHLVAQGGWPGINRIQEAAPDQNILLIASREERAAQ